MHPETSFRSPARSANPHSSLVLHRPAYPACPPDSSESHPSACVSPRPYPPTEQNYTASLPQNHARGWLRQTLASNLHSPTPSKSSSPPARHTVDCVLSSHIPQVGSQATTGSGRGSGCCDTESPPAEP